MTKEMVYLVVFGTLNSQIVGVMQRYGNNNLQLMLSTILLNSGHKVTDTLVMTLVVSTKMENMVHIVMMTEEFMLLTTTMATNLV